MLSSSLPLQLTLDVFSLDHTIFPWLFTRVTFQDLLPLVAYANSEAAYPPYCSVLALSPRTSFILRARPGFLSMACLTLEAEVQHSSPASFPLRAPDLFLLIALL